MLGFFLETSCSEPPSSCQVLGSSFQSSVRIISRLDWLSPVQLVLVLEFYLVPSSGIYSSSVSFCLTFCVYGVCSAGCWIIIHSTSAICPLPGEAGLEACAGFLVGVLVPAHWCLELDPNHLVDRTMSRNVFRICLEVAGDSVGSLSTDG